jgi:hypothetical protein
MATRTRFPSLYDVTAPEGPRAGRSSTTGTTCAARSAARPTSSASGSRTACITPR